MGLLGFPGSPSSSHSPQTHIRLTGHWTGSRYVCVWVNVCVPRWLVTSPGCIIASHPQNSGIDCGTPRTPPPLFNRTWMDGYRYTHTHTLTPRITHHTAEVRPWERSVAMWLGQKVPGSNKTREAFTAPPTLTARTHRERVLPEGQTFYLCGSHVVPLQHNCQHGWTCVYAYWLSKRVGHLSPLGVLSRIAPWSPVNNLVSPCCWRMLATSGFHAFRFRFTWPRSRTSGQFLSISWVIVFAFFLTVLWSGLCKARCCEKGDGGY